MAIENLPRPWVLAALTGLRIEELVATDEGDRQDPRRQFPRPEPRRHHLCEVAGCERSGDGDQVRLN